MSPQSGAIGQRDTTATTANKPNVIVSGSPTMLWPYIARRFLRGMSTADLIRFPANECARCPAERAPRANEIETKIFQYDCVFDLIDVHVWQENSIIHFWYCFRHRHTTDTYTRALTWNCVVLCSVCFFSIARRTIYTIIHCVYVHMQYVFLSLYYVQPSSIRGLIFIMCFWRARVCPCICVHASVCVCVSWNIWNWMHEKGNSNIVAFMYFPII